jgi:type VII secretion integral membrane protein EccD
MTTPIPGPNPHVDGSPFCRVTVVTPTARMDVALPTDLTVAELVPMLTELADEVGRRARRRTAPGALCLAAVAGAELPPASTLASLGVLDGDLLRLRPRADNPPPPVFDDPVDAVAATIRPGSGVTDGWGDRGPVFDDEPVVVRPWDDRWRRAAGLTGCGAAGPLAAVLFAAIRGYGPQASATASILAGIAAATAMVAAVRTQRTDPAVAAVLVCCAVALAAAAGFAGLPGEPGPGHVLLSTALAAAVSASGLALSAGAAPPLVAIVLAGVITAFVGLVAVGADLVTPAGSGALAATVAVGLLPTLPRFSTRLAGLPAPVVPTTPAEMLVADQQWEQADPEQIRYRAELAQSYLAGLVLGATAVAGAGAIVASAGGGRLGCAFGAVVVAVLMLRSRAYATAVASLVPFAAGLLAGTVIVVAVAERVPPGFRVAGAVGLLAAAAVGLWLVFSGRDREPSPVARRVVDVLEGLLVMALFPLALWVLDIYEFVRNLS